MRISEDSWLTIFPDALFLFNMKTVVAETVMLGAEVFKTIGDVTVIPDREIGPAQIAAADVLIIRSPTRVTRELIANSSLKFIGTATAGFEHIDTAAVEECGIQWSAAPGCNADSVADYITAALFKLNIELAGKTIGIIGVGEVGSRVAKRAAALGLNILLNDPPRAEKETSGDFTPLETLLAEADIVTLHTPLTAGGKWPTLHLADEKFFAEIKSGAVFINAARGKIVDDAALLNASRAGKISKTVLDVWDPEPQIPAELLHIAAIGTPHIAGHSFEGKLNGTMQMYQAVCGHFNIPATWNPAPVLPPVDVPELTIDSRGKTDLEVIAEAVAGIYDITRDCLTAETVSQFDILRKNYPVRRELKNTVVHLSEHRPELTARLIGAGFGSEAPHRR